MDFMGIVAETFWAGFKRSLFAGLDIVTSIIAILSAGIAWLLFWPIYIVDKLHVCEHSGGAGAVTFAISAFLTTFIYSFGYYSFAYLT